MIWWSFGIEMMIDWMNKITMNLIKMQINLKHFNTVDSNERSSYTTLETDDVIIAIPNSKLPFATLFSVLVLRSDRERLID